jgi:5-methyltetrahydrofolate--homocysteine methyltransferase
MKKAVSYLIPFIEEEKQKGASTTNAGTVVLATVKGDVHDIGKNIVGVVLSCNNYRVVDLGVMVSCDRILQAVRDEKADVLGLSGLITPSLDEMAHVASEMNKAGFTIPLLIGGATTSKKHTAVKLEPEYQPGVVHVLDASRSVPVVSSLLNKDTREDFLSVVKADYENIREEYEAGGKHKVYLSLEAARDNRLKLHWTDGSVCKPSNLGVRVKEKIPLSLLRKYIDWTPFFHTWELKGRYPAILSSEEYGEEASSLFSDAQELLSKIEQEELLEARAVLGIFRANSVNTDDIEIYRDEQRCELLAVIHTLRQQSERRKGISNLALADFIAPKESNYPDHLGMFVVSAGFGCEALCALFEKDNDDYRSIMTKALADRLAEAAAEWLHEYLRRDYWGYAAEETLSGEGLIREQYEGIRPAPGYPACPDHTEKITLFNLIEAEKRIGVTLTETCAMMPAASVSGFYFARAESRYFGVGKIQRDQLEDYARRKGLSVAEAERWLSANLGY